MEKRILRRRGAVLAAWVTGLTLALSGCAGGGGGTTHPSGGAESRTVTEPDSAPSADTSPETLRVKTNADDAERTAYYESLIADLRQSLLDEKADRYVSDHEYAEKLAALEADLAALRADARPSVPTGGEPESAPAGDETFGSPSAPDAEPETTSPPPGTQKGGQTGGAPSEPVTAAYRFGMSDGGAVIHEYLGTSRTAAVPRLVNGAPVTAIADNAFRSKNVSAVILPDTLESIGWFAFCGCFDLQSVTIPASVTSIAYGAFDGCPSLVVLCPEDSYAAVWAASYGLRVQYI